jgi:hypothetical protein
MAEENITLEDIGEGGVTLEELLPDTPALNQTAPNSVRNSAATVALLSDDPEEVLPTYNRMHTAGLEGNTEEADATMNRVDREYKEAEKEVAMDMMGDPRIPLEDKQKVIQTTLVADPKEDDATVLLQKKALTRDVAAESAREERIRMSRLEGAKWAAEKNRQLNAQVEAAAAEMDTPGYFSTLIDVTELFGIPFAETLQARRISEELTGEPGGILLGNIQKHIRDYMKQQPGADQVEMAQRLIDILKEDSGAVKFNKKNEFAMFMYLQNVASGREVSDTEVFIDNAASALELVFLAFPAGRIAGKVISKAIKGTPKAVSPAVNIRGYNPDMSRNQHKLASMDETEEASEALYGVDRETALADDLAPQVNITGDVEVRTVDVGREVNKELVPDPIAYRGKNNVADIQYLPEEVRQMEAWVMDKISGSVHVKPEPSMTKVGRSPGGLRINTVYTSKNGGFATAEEALERTKFTLRDFGIVDSDMRVLKNVDGEYKVVDDLSGEGDFVAQVKFDYSYDATNIARFEDTKPTVRLGFIGAEAAEWNPTWQRYLFDPASTQHPSIFKSANQVSDRQYGIQSILLDNVKKFSSAAKKLPKEERNELFAWFKKANHEGLGIEDMPSTYSPAMKEAAKLWRERWDTIWALENRDVVRTMQARGMRVWEDRQNGSKLYVTPVKNPSGYVNVKVLDPSTDTIRNVSNAELKEIYEMGGQIGELKSPIKQGEEVADYLLVPNNSKSYFRAVRDIDTPMAYRKGYYHVDYGNDNLFVRKYVRDKNGNIVTKANGSERTRAIAVTGSKSEAETILKNKAADEGVPVEEFGKTTRDTMDINRNFDDYWDVQETAGRSSQKYRGKMLETGDTPGVTSMDSAYIANPIDSLIASTKSIARRTAFRPWIEGQKKRFMAQYGDLLEVNDKAQPMFPSGSKGYTSIGKKGDDKERVAAARIQWEYINSMENAYNNGVDGFIKGALQHWADKLGVRGKTVREGAVNFAARNTSKPVAVGRNLAFQMYLAAAPLRQVLVQGHQAVQITALNPAYALTKMPVDLTAMMAGVMGQYKVAAKMWGVSPEKAKRIVNAYRQTGLSASIDHQALVSGAINTLVDNASYAGGLKAGASRIASTPKTVGFDFGEWINQTTAYMYYRDRALRQARKDGVRGFDVDSPVNSAEVAANSRNFTYNMNAAGEMPYNHGNLGLIMQFMQVPHKAILNMTTNKNLTKLEKTQLMAFNLAAYGIGGGYIANQVAQFLPDAPEEVRDAVIFGLEAAAINGMINYATEEDNATRINIDNLAPMNLGGIADLFTAFATGGGYETLARTPAGALFAGNGRVAHAMKTLLSYAGVADYMPVEDESQVLVALGKLSSGYSAYWKAHLYSEHGKLRSATNSELQADLTPMEELALHFGLTTHDIVSYYDTSKDQYNASADMKNDVKLAFNDYMRAMNDQGMSVENLDQMAKMFSYMRGKFGEFPAAMDEFNRLWNQKNAARTVAEKAMHSAGFRSQQEIITEAVGNGATDEDLEQIREAFGAINMTDEAYQKLVDDLREEQE